MRMLIVTTLLVTFFATNAIGANVHGIVQSCSEGEFFNVEEQSCEPCTECNDFLYERESCSSFKDTVCGWCGAKKPVKNAEYYRKCHLKHRAFDEERFEKEFRSRVMRKLLKEGSDMVSDEVIDIDQLPDRRELPPLPTDDDYDSQEYYDDEDLDKVRHEDVPASEEDLEGKEIVDRYEVQPIDDKYEEDDKHEKLDFAPISGKEFLQRDDRNEDSDSKEGEDDFVHPVNVNEAKIGQENEIVKKADEVRDSNGGRINIVAIAVRKRPSSDEDLLEYNDDEEDDDEYESDSRYSSLCHTMGIYLYLITFIILMSLLLKRCFKTNNVPVVNFTEEQCAMIHRCADHMKKSKEAAIYDNNLAYV